MPRSTREWAQRKLDAASNNIKWSQQHLREVCERYLDQHPEISTDLLLTIEISTQLQNAITYTRSKI
ncbi:hypothetical protein ES703_111184 [subsurface metagenome]